MAHQYTCSGCQKRKRCAMVHCKGKECVGKCLPCRRWRPKEEPAKQALKESGALKPYLQRVREETTCPECKASPGDYCKDGDRDRVKLIHGARITAFENPQPSSAEFEVFCRVREKTFEHICDMLASKDLEISICDKLDGEEIVGTPTQWVRKAVKSALEQAIKHLNDIPLQPALRPRIPEGLLRANELGEDLEDEEHLV